VTRDAWDITYSQLEILVALLAAENIGLHGATTAELGEIDVGQSDYSHMGQLERGRWIVCIGRNGELGRQKIWAPHPRTRKALGFERLREVG
jgi:hypothetical protein